MPVVVESVVTEGVFSVEKFVENFDLLVEASGSIEQLRTLVLELAVRGNLTREERGDTPIRIDEECDPDSAPFPVRTLWRWARLKSLCEVITKGSSPKWQGVNYVEGSGKGILFVTSENVGAGRMLLEQPKYVEKSFNEIEPRSVLRRGDLLMNIVGASIGRAAIFDRDDVANINQAVCLIRLIDKPIRINPAFLLRFFNSPTCITFMFDKQVENARANLSMGNIAQFFIPLPPLAEQKRIVARVDQLMALIDNLEQKQTRKRQLGANFTKASLEALTGAESPEEFDTAWKRVVENWGVVVDRPDKVWFLRKAILGLAGCGRLVLQQATDEPAEHLVKKAQAQLAGEARPRQQERQHVPEQVLPTLPPGWTAVPWKMIGLCQNGRSFPSGDYANHGVKLLRPGNLHVSGEVQWTSDNTRYLPERYAKEFPEFIVSSGELIMNLTAQSLKDEFLGRVCITGPDERCLLNQRQARLTPFGLDPQYLFWYFRTPFFRNYVDGLNKGTLIQHMFTSQVNEAIILVPPLAEQKRIVAKVDHLMKLCDELEAKLRRAEDRASKLVEAVVGEMVE